MEPRFFLTYDECRARFRALARRAGAALEAFELAARGPQDQRLTIDVATLGAVRPARVLVVQSGTHGIEGYFGSAVQQELFAAQLPELELPGDAALVVIHAVNPWGMAFWRRANESNVDLNRNFVDFSLPRPARPDYAALFPLLCPREITEGTELAFFAAARRLVEKHGRSWLVRVLTEGQWECPEGLYYGGSRSEESNRLVRRIYREHVAGAREALLVDLHTGFGAFGECTLLSAHAAKTPEQAWLERAFSAFRLEVTVDAADPATPHKDGQLARGVAAELPGVAFRAFTVEIGTHPDERILQAERHEHWLHRFGDRESERGSEILLEHRECSCPDSDAWREQALVHGRAVLAASARAIRGA